MKTYEPEWRVAWRAFLEKVPSSAAKLVAEAGIKHGTYNNWMRTTPAGEPSISDALSLCRAAGVTLNDIWGDKQIEDALTEFIRRHERELRNLVEIERLKARSEAEEQARREVSDALAVVRKAASAGKGRRSKRDGG